MSHTYVEDLLTVRKLMQLFVTRKIIDMRNVHIEVGCFVIYGSGRTLLK